MESQTSGIEEGNTKWLLELFTHKQTIYFLYCFFSLFIYLFMYLPVYSTYELINSSTFFVYLPNLNPLKKVQRLWHLEKKQGDWQLRRIVILSIIEPTIKRDKTRP